MPTNHEIHLTSSVHNQAPEPMLPRAYTRRNLLRSAALAGALGLGLLSAAACGNKPTANDQPVSTTQTGGEAVACSEGGELSAQAVAMRKSLSYVDQAPDPARPCRGCSLFKAAQDGAVCGGCLVITGQVAPSGYCTAWVARG